MDVFEFETADPEQQKRVTLIAKALAEAAREILRSDSRLANVTFSEVLSAFGSVYVEYAHFTVPFEVALQLFKNLWPGEVPSDRTEPSSSS